tara:strand:- start:1561 stop:2106 length:546 start_codon:yes stop_codon:yes gene_type:complete
MNNDWGYEKHFKSRSECSGYWHNKSIHLKQSAGILSTAWESGELLDSGDTYRMLMGMSLELIFKAFYVANKKIPPTIHTLNNLSAESGINFSDKEKKILEVLSEYVVWEGKYPIPKDTKCKPGPESLRKQWSSLSKSGNYSAGLIDQKVVSISKFGEDDLSYSNLTNLWGKVNSRYIEQNV